MYCRNEEPSDGYVVSVFDNRYVNRVVTIYRQGHDIAVLEFGQEGICRIEQVQVAGSDSVWVKGKVKLGILFDSIRYC